MGGVTHLNGGRAPRNKVYQFALSDALQCFVDLQDDRMSFNKTILMRVTSLRVIHTVQNFMHAAGDIPELGLQTLE